VLVRRYEEGFYQKLIIDKEAMENGFKIDPDSDLCQRGIQSRKRLWDCISTSKALGLGIGIEPDSTTANDSSNQQGLSDNQKQKLRNAKRYRWTGSRWICKECNDTGDKFYIRVHFCPVFLERIRKEKEEVQIQNKVEGIPKKAEVVGHSIDSFFCGREIDCLAK